METDVQLAVGYIETFAGNGKARSTGDGKRAVKAGIPLPHHVALDRDERWLYFAESGSDRVRRVNLAEGTVHNFAGIGETCYSGDEGPCGEAGLYLPLDVACDSRNDLYVCDSGSNRIRKIDRETGIITTVVGTGEHGFNGDGPALEVNLTWSAAIAFDADDVMYIADTQAHRIRRYDSRTGLVETIAGSWTAEDEAREQPLVARNLVVLSGDAIGIDFSDDNGWLMPVCSDGLSLSMYLDDGHPAMEARLYDIVGIAVDNAGDVYVVDKGSNRVRKIDHKTGLISTLAGVCRYGYDGDGKPAAKSSVSKARRSASGFWSIWAVPATIEFERWMPTRASLARWPVTVTAGTMIRTWVAVARRGLSPKMPPARLSMVMVCSPSRPWSILRWG